MSYFRINIFGQTEVRNLCYSHYNHFRLFFSVAPQILYGIKPYIMHQQIDTFTELLESFKWYHLTTNLYIISFFVGILFGFLMKKKVAISKSLEILLWIISISMMVSVSLWHNSLWRLNESAPYWSVILWFSIGKLLYSIGCSCIYYLLCNGKGGTHYSKYL